MYEKDKSIEFCSNFFFFFHHVYYCPYKFIINFYKLYIGSQAPAQEKGKGEQDLLQGIQNVILLPICWGSEYEGWKHQRKLISGVGQNK